MLRTRSSILFFIASLGALLFFKTSVFAQSESEVSIWDGIYTDEQAARGGEQFNANCSSCHSIDLRGNSNTPTLRGVGFMFIWENRTLGEMFAKMRAEMPSDRPGSLSGQAYVDALSYILKSNEFPSGSNELAIDQDMLDKILITPMP